MAKIDIFHNVPGDTTSLTMTNCDASDKDDLVILVSSSGRSPNIIKAAQKTKELKLKLITLTGFDKNNPLKKLGDINFWVDSRAYNIIENTHLIWLLAVNDLIFGNAEYTA